MNTLIDVLEQLEIADAIENNYRLIWGGNEDLDKAFFSFKLFKGRDRRMRGSLQVSNNTDFNSPDAVYTWLFPDTVAKVVNKLEYYFVKNDSLENILHRPTADKSNPVIEFRIVFRKPEEGRITLRLSYYLNKERVYTELLAEQKIA